MRWLVLGLLLPGCVMSRAVRPVPEDAVVVHASVGGPAFQYGSTPLPAPISAVGLGYGIDGRTSVHGEALPTQLVLFGVAGLSGGVSHEVFPTDGARPRLMLDGSALGFLGGVGGTKGAFFVDASAVTSWDVGRFTPYVLGELLVQPAPSHRFVPAIALGSMVRTGRVQWQLEMGLDAPTSRNLPNFVEWNGIAQHGAVSAQLGATVLLGDKSW